MTRLDWDSYFMRLAQVASERSPCCRRQVGTVLVRDNNAVATGYNGPPKGASHRTLDPGPKQCIRVSKPSGDPSEACCVHSEANSVAIAAKRGVSTEGSVAYVTLLPCSNCARLLINAGIRKVVYFETYGDTSGVDVFAESGVECIKYEAKS